MLYANMMAALLDFRDPVLEHQYSQITTLYRHNVYDKNACVAQAFFNVLGCTSLYMHRGELDAWSWHLAWLALLIAACSNSLHMALLLLLPTDTYVRLRTPMIAALRTFNIAWTAIIIPPIMPSGIRGDRIGFVLLYKAGILTACLNSIMHPLRLREHLQCQLAGTGIFMLSLAGPSCQLTLTRPVSAQAISQLQQVYEMATAVFFGLHGALYKPSDSACLPTVVYTQLLLALMLPSAIAYVLERRSRLSFLCQRYPQQEVASTGDLGASPAVCYLVVLCLVCTWCMCKMYL